MLHPLNLKDLGAKEGGGRGLGVRGLLEDEAKRPVLDHGLGDFLLKVGDGDAVDRLGLAANITRSVTDEELMNLMQGTDAGHVQVSFMDHDLFHGSHVCCPSYRQWCRAERDVRPSSQLFGLVRQLRKVCPLGPRPVAEVEDAGCRSLCH